MLACTTPQGLTAPRAHRPFFSTRRGPAPSTRRLAAARCAASGSGSGGDKAPGSSSYPLPLQRLARSAAAVAAAGLLLAGTAPASLADITTVTAQQAIDQARPLPQQNVNKGRIWMLFVLGATALFGSTVVLENNSKWFPAISRANQAMKQARERQERKEKNATAEDARREQGAAVDAEQAAFEQRLAAVQQERVADAAAEAAVLEGMLEARERISGSVPPLAAAAAVPPAAAAVAIPATAEAAEAPAVEQHSSGDEPDSSAGGAAIGSSSGGSGSGETRKPLFEISAEQIQESERVRLLQLELEKRQAAAAAGSGGSGGSAAEP